jgi:hypothetical protein
MQFIVVYNATNGDSHGYVAEAEPQCDLDAVEQVQNALQRRFCDNPAELIEIQFDENFDVIQVDTLEKLEA